MLLPVVAIRLPSSGLQRLRARIETARPRHRLDLHPSGLVEITSRHGAVKGNCLSCSLTLLRLLRFRGVDADLKLGVRRGDALESHAWVELEGRPLNDTETVAERFDPFPAL